MKDLVVYSSSNDYSAIEVKTTPATVYKSLQGSAVTSVTINFGKKLQVFSVDELNHVYFYSFLSRVSPLLNKAFSGLLKSRDFLGYQLDYALGNIGEDLFNQIKTKYLAKKEKYTEQDLKNQVVLLQNLTSHTFDADTIEDIFNCELDDAEKALETLDSENRSLHIACTYGS